MNYKPKRSHSSSSVSHFQFLSAKRKEKMATNAVRAYFNRNWRRQDMMSSAPIPQHARTTLKRRNRFFLMMVVAFCFGTSVGPFTKHFFEIDQRIVDRVWQGLAIVFGCFWFAARIYRERSQIYIGVLIETWPLMRIWFDNTQWMLKVHVLLALFMVYLMLYSQEILYDAHFGDVDHVNCTFTVFFCLPTIVVHVVRLCLGANIEQQRQN